MADITRIIPERVSLPDNGICTGNYIRSVSQITAVTDEARRKQMLYRSLSENLRGTDNTFYPVLFVRSITETKGIAGTLHRCKGYVRGIYEEAGILANTVSRADYCRIERETAQAGGSLFRHLSIFIRLLASSFAHDFIKRRFLIAREVLTVKSAVSREIFLESKLV